MKISKHKRVFASIEDVTVDVHIKQEKPSSNAAVNVNKTGFSYYDNFLNEKDSQYMQENKNRIGYVEEMSPNEYYDRCAHDVFNTSVERLIQQRKYDSESIESLQDILDRGGKFWLPFINLADKSQEGLHRMMVLGDNYGWDTAFPVLVVESADPHIDDVNEAFKQFNRAQSNARDYLYKASQLPQDFVTQAQYELERYDDETPYVMKLVEQDDEKFVVSLEGFEDDFDRTIWYSNMRIDYEEDDDEDEYDFDVDEELESADLEDIEDYFFRN